MVKICRIVVIILCPRRSNRVNGDVKGLKNNCERDADKENDDVYGYLNHDILGNYNIGFREHLNHQQLHKRRMGIGENILREELQFLRRRQDKKELYTV